MHQETYYKPSNKKHFHEEVRILPVRKRVLKPSRTLWGSWAQGAFLFSLHDLPCAPKGRFKQLLIREGRGCRDKAGAVKKQQCSLGTESWFCLNGYT